MADAFTAIGPRITRLSFGSAPFLLLFRPHTSNSQSLEAIWVQAIRTQVVFEVVVVVVMEAVVVEDSDSCAATEIDPESVHSSGSELNDADQGESEAKRSRVSVDDTTTLRFWRGLTNMAHHIYLVDGIPEITWHLPEPAEADEIFHGARHIEAILNMGVTEFKIGITCHPARRWSPAREVFGNECHLCL